MDDTSGGNKIDTRVWYPEVMDNAKKHSTEDHLQKEYYDKEHLTYGKWRASQWISGTPFRKLGVGFRWNTIDSEQSAKQLAVGYVLQLFKAAGTFQCLGFIHDDLHDGNVMIAGDKIVVIDFDRMKSIYNYRSKLGNEFYKMRLLLGFILKFGGIDGDSKKCLMERLHQLLELEKGLPNYCSFFESKIPNALTVKVENVFSECPQ
jgi:hypothetical protein